MVKAKDKELSHGICIVTATRGSGGARVPPEGFGCVGKSKTPGGRRRYKTLNLFCVALMLLEQFPQDRWRA